METTEGIQSGSFDIKAAHKKIAEARDKLSEGQKQLYERLRPGIRAALIAGIMLFHFSGEAESSQKSQVDQLPLTVPPIEHRLEKLPYTLVLPTIAPQVEAVGYPQAFIGPPQFTMCHEKIPTYDWADESTPDEDPITNVFKGDVESIKSSDLTPEDIKGSYHPLVVDSEGKITDGHMNVLLVPVGYDSPTKEMEERLTYLNQAFDGINIHFSYVNKSMPITINTRKNRIHAYDRAEIDAVLDKVNALTGRYYYKVAVLVQTDERWVGSVAWHDVNVTFQDSYRNSTTIHEMGHIAGLDDRYLANYKSGALEWSTEFTINPLGTYSQSLWRSLGEKPPIYPTGATCNGNTVFSYYPYSKWNVMANSNIKTDVLKQHLDEENGVFNPIQRIVMAKHILQEAQEHQFTSPHRRIVQPTNLE